MKVSDLKSLLDRYAGPNGEVRYVLVDETVPGSKTLTIQPVSTL